jgi:hypothetical protein
MKTLKEFVKEKLSEGVFQPFNIARLAAPELEHDMPLLTELARKIKEIIDNENA